MESIGVPLQRTILQETAKINIVRHPAKLSNILDATHYKGHLEILALISWH